MEEKCSLNTTVRTVKQHGGENEHSMVLCQGNKLSGAKSVKILKEDLLIGSQVGFTNQLVTVTSYFTNVTVKSLLITLRWLLLLLPRYLFHFYQMSQDGYLKLKTTILIFFFLTIQLMCSLYGEDDPYHVKGPNFFLLPLFSPFAHLLFILSCSQRQRCSFFLRLTFSLSL